MGTVTHATTSMMMMGKPQLVLTLLAFVLTNSALGLVVRSKESTSSMEERLEVDNPYCDHTYCYGWDEEYCSDGYAFAFDMKYAEPGLAIEDQTATNGVKLYCRDDLGTLTDQITSTEGEHGKWQGVRSCPVNDKMTGFRLRVWPYQGIGEDWAVDNVQMFCSSNITLDGMGDPVQMDTKNKFDTRSLSESMEVVKMSINSRTLIHGDWTNWAMCSPGYYIMGIKTMVEDAIAFEDDAALTNMVLFCSND